MNRRIPDELQTPDGFFECTACHEELPQTPEYFHRDSNNNSGYKTICKMCRAQAKREKEEEAFHERVKQIDDMSMNLLGAIAQTKEPTNIPHIAVVLEKIMELYGGAEGYAKHFMSNYLMSKPGSQMRHKALSTVMNLAVKVSESGAAKIPLELLSEEDLEREIEKRARLLIYTGEEEEREAS